ncbi:hypothetical protein [Rhodopseudomonas parapalustris]
MLEASHRLPRARMQACHGVGLPHGESNAPPNTNLAAAPIELDVGAALLMTFNRVPAVESRRSSKIGDDV